MKTTDSHKENKDSGETTDNNNNTFHIVILLLGYALCPIFLIIVSVFPFIRLSS